MARAKQAGKDAVEKPTARLQNEVECFAAAARGLLDDAEAMRSSSAELWRELRLLGVAEPKNGVKARELLRQAIQLCAPRDEALSSLRNFSPDVAAAAADDPTLLRDLVRMHRRSLCGHLLPLAAQYAKAARSIGNHYRTCRKLWSSVDKRLRCIRGPNGYAAHGSSCEVLLQLAGYSEVCARTGYFHATHSQHPELVQGVLWELAELEERVAVEPADEKRARQLPESRESLSRESLSEDPRVKWLISELRHGPRMLKVLETNADAAKANGEHNVPSRRSISDLLRRGADAKPPLFRQVKARGPWERA